jgi:hypothetical protein
MPIHAPAFHNGFPLEYPFALSLSLVQLAPGSRRLVLESDGVIEEIESMLYVDYARIAT